MQGEYKGKPIFSRRYVSMNEEAIREDIDRLQGELYSMQEALDLFGKGNSEIKQQILDSQESNEALLKKLEIKVGNLEDALDYSIPLKTQLSDAVAEFRIKLNDIYDSANYKAKDKTTKIVLIVSVINTLLLLVLTGLLLYSILN